MAAGDRLRKMLVTSLGFDLIRFWQDPLSIPTAIARSSIIWKNGLASARLTGEHPDPKELLHLRPQWSLPNRRSAPIYAASSAAPCVRTAFSYRQLTICPRTFDDQTGRCRTYLIGRNEELLTTGAALRQCRCWTRPLIFRLRWLRWQSFCRWFVSAVFCHDFSYLDWNPMIIRSAFGVMALIAIFTLKITNVKMVLIFQVYWTQIRKTICT